jgi:hypothetical protein
MDLLFAEKILKIIRERRDVVTEALTEGAVQDFAAFRHLRGKYEVWSELEQEIRSLLKRETEEDD